MIIDTHSHIYDESFDQDVETVIIRAKQSGVSKILLPNIDIDSIQRLLSLSTKHQDYCLPMMGLHPTSVSPNWQNDLIIIKKQFNSNSFIAVGEIGIDLYWDKTLEKEQRAAFEEQLRWSIELNLPVSIHSRDAIGACIECIHNVGSDQARGVFHSFGGNESELKNILALKNFYIGINGTVTYKNSTLPAVLLNTDLTHIIIETDAPYLPPVPYRGKRNEPSYTKYISQKLAEVYNTTTDEVEIATTANAVKLYSL